MEKHQNLFYLCVSKAEVYQQLQQDYEQDQKKASWFSCGFFFIIPTAFVVSDSYWRYLLMMVGAYCVLKYVITFIELSNRNYLMHAIDWHEASERLTTKGVDKHENIGVEQSRRAG